MKDYPFELAKVLPVNQDTKVERGRPITCREWDSYPSIFLLSTDPECWNNKSILDVGSGDKWDDPSRTFPGAKVCAIDPEFGEKGRIKWNTAHETVPGIVQNIPYGDESFDHVVSSHAVTQHVSPKDMSVGVLEMLRVAKVSGDVRLVPCIPKDLSGIDGMLMEAGFMIDLSQTGSDGPMAIINAGPDIQDPATKAVVLNKIRTSMGLAEKVS